MPKLRTVIALWLPVAGVTVVLGFSLYAISQQVQRTDANDPQIQLARDAATALNEGADPSTLLGDQQVEVMKSLAPFTVLYDDSGRVLATNATGADADFLTPPAGVLTAARASGENILTWQPSGDIREAAVVVPWDGDGTQGTLLVARNMQLVEQREGRTLQMAFLALVGALIAAAIGAVLGAWLLERREPATPA